MDHKLNNGYFDVEEPASGHFRRFEAKLDQRFHRRRNIAYIRILAAAAAIALLLGGTWLAGWFGGQNEPVQRMSLSDLSEEYAEVEYFFTSGIDKSMDELLSMAAEAKIDVNAMFAGEMNEMDSVYQVLQADLAAHPEDDRIIEAMISYYQVKLGLIRRILAELQKIKTQNTKNHESVEM
jgi:hypothetical protein